MSNVYILRKNTSMQFASGTSGPQVNIGGNNKKLDYSTMSPNAQKWGNRAKNLAYVPAAWSALSSLANDNRGDLFSSMGSAGLSAAASHNVASGAMEPFGARQGEKSNQRKNPTHYDKDGNYIGPPQAPQNNSGTIAPSTTIASPTPLITNSTQTTLPGFTPQSQVTVPDTSGTNTAAMNSMAYDLMGNPILPNDDNNKNLNPMDAANQSLKDAQSNMSNSQQILNKKPYGSQ